MAMERTVTGGNALPRLLLLCAVLSGLFLMHGAMGVAGGCHGGMPTRASAHSGMAQSAETRSTPRLAHADAASFVALPATTMPDSGGSLCVSTPPRDDLAHPGAVALGLSFLLPLLVTRPAGAAPRAPDTTRRAPPPGGRALSLELCVART